MVHTILVACRYLDTAGVVGNGLEGREASTNAGLPFSRVVVLFSLAHIKLCRPGIPPVLAQGQK